MMRRVMVALMMVAVGMSLTMTTGCGWFRKGDKDFVPSTVVEKKVEEPKRAVPGTEQVAQADMPTIYFDFDKSDIRADQKSRLEKGVAYMKANAKVEIRIEGNCDDRGTNEYNMSLGDRRADSIKQFLVGQGIAAMRVSVLSRGEENPAAQGQNEEAWAKNRRGEFFYTAK